MEREVWLALVLAAMLAAHGGVMSLCLLVWHWRRSVAPPATPLPYRTAPDAPSPTAAAWPRFAHVAGILALYVGAMVALLALVDAGGEWGRACH